MSVFFASFDRDGAVEMEMKNSFRRFKVLFTHIMQKPLGLQSNDNSDQLKFPTR